LVDLVAALLRAGLERAFLHLSTEAFLHGLDELLLSAGLLVDDDAGGAVDLGFLLALGLLSGALGLLNVVGSLEGADHGGVGLLALLLGQAWALSAFHLSFRVSSGSLLQSGQSQLDGGWRDDGVLVILLLLGLLVQLGGQGAVGLFQSLQKLELGLALLLTTLLLLLLPLLLLPWLLLPLLLLPLLLLLTKIQAGFTAFLLALLLQLLQFVVIVLILVLLLILVVLALTVPASILLLLVSVFVHVAVVAGLVIFVVQLVVATLLLLVLSATDQLVEGVAVVVGTARSSEAHKSDQNDEIHSRQ